MLGGLHGERLGEGERHAGLVRAGSGVLLGWVVVEDSVAALELGMRVGRVLLGVERLGVGWGGWGWVWWRDGAWCAGVV